MNEAGLARKLITAKGPNEIRHHSSDFSFPDKRMIVVGSSGEAAANTKSITESSRRLRSSTEIQEPQSIFIKPAVAKPKQATLVVTAIKGHSLDLAGRTNPAIPSSSMPQNLPSGSF